MTDFQPVGHYAIKVVFDTEESATFTWEGLRNLDPTDETAAEPEVDISQLPEVDRDTVIRALRRVYDPEIPVNIYDLGLIYNLDIHPNHTVDLKMTLTTPGCPEAATFPGKVEQAVRSVPGVVDARVELVWEPPWTKDHMSEEAKLALGIW
ncbi:MAG: SUF system Fe-S cluster assembly protein [Gemmatimonadetes bacterium]|nr:SUF system Fe-S cluster assembly protein [Thermoplasmata archaeon]NIX42509.1 SUF system Fe-S cluster assembly protein [Gemmatimonadota bacterium]